MKKYWTRWKYVLIGWLGATLVRIWFSTIRMEVRFPVDAPRKNSLPGQSAILGGWHETVLPCSYYVGPIHPCALVSKSGDGELISAIMQGLGWRTIRGSSSRGGQGAFLRLIRMGRITHPFRMAFTLDGPRGPRRKAKLGAIQAASTLGIPLIPVGVHVNRAWRMKSWDRMFIPKPFSRIVIVANELIHVPKDLDDPTAEHYRLRLEEGIARAEETARQILEGTTTNLSTSLDQAA